jgi:hypothetical protein
MRHPPALLRYCYLLLYRGRVIRETSQHLG